MSFGTGHNETTQLVLEMMCGFLKPNDKYMLDFGCGTGVLSIAGIKLGLDSVIAIDIDEEAIENAKDYFRINNVSEFVKLFKKNISEIKETGFDIICANIVRSVIEENLKIISNKLKQSGKLFLSGILTEEDNRICNALSNDGFKIVEKFSKADWLGIYALKEE